MSDDRIYVRFKGKTLGPLSEEKVSGLIRRGQITRMHELSADGLAWQRAEEFGELFRSTSRATHAAAPSGSATSRSPAVPSSTPIPGQVSDDGVEWYAYIDGENQGPIKLQSLLLRISAGDVGRDSLVWRAGLSEWRAASEVLPEYFSSSPHQTTSATAHTSAGTVDASGREGSLPADICEGFTSQRAWVTILSALGLVVSGLAVIYFITGMIVGADARWLPFGGSRSVVYGLTGLLFCGLAIAGEVLLLGYGSSLKGLQQHRDATHMLRAANRLQLFWKYCAIVVIAVLILLVGFAVLLVVMAAAAASART